MTAIVVYESIYGNTRQVAEAVAAGLGDARVLSVQEAAGHVPRVDLLIVGGPTHIHGMTTSRSRKAAAQEADPNAGSELGSEAADEPGLRDWLADLPRIINAQAAAFDTRLHGSSLLTGSASHGIARRLRGHGYRVVDTASFVVTEGEGPLAEGELERAREWGAQLARSQPAAVDRRLG